MSGAIAKGILVAVGILVIACAAAPEAAAQSQRGAAAQDVHINDAAFMEFVLQRSGAHADEGMRQRAASTRLTGEQRRELAAILRDARRVAADSIEIADDIAEASPPSTDIASSIQAAASALDDAAVQQDYQAFSDSLDQLAQTLTDGEAAAIVLQATLASLALAAVALSTSLSDFAGGQVFIGTGPAMQRDNPDG